MLVTHADIPIPTTTAPVIRYKFNGPEIELEFVKWTVAYLVVKYPKGSNKAGQPWKLGRRLVNHWLKSGVLKIEGPVPEFALIA